MNKDTRHQESVYKYFDEHGILIYVGITSRGAYRNVEHNMDKTWWHLVAHQEVEHYDTRSQSEAREKALIRRHLPPYNIQHNPEHSQMRAAYDKYRQSLPSADSSRGDLLNRLGRKMPLMVVGESETPNNARVVTFATPLRYAPVTRSLEQKAQAKAVIGTARVGTVEAIRQVGPIARLDVIVRKGVEIGNPFARLKLVPEKGLSNFRIHSIQLDGIADINTGEAFVQKAPYTRKAAS